MELFYSLIKSPKLLLDKYIKMLYYFFNEVNDMCLDTIEKTGNIKDGFGYKVFYSVNGKLTCQYACCEPKANKWIKASDFPPTSYSGLMRNEGGYQTGWHIFTSKRDALKHQGLDRFDLVVRKIKYRKSTALGKWANARTIVAKEMRILEEV